LWGTVGGAWESGERAADTVLRKLGPATRPAAPEAEAKPSRKAERTRRERHERREESPIASQKYWGTPNIMRNEQ